MVEFSKTVQRISELSETINVGNSRKEEYGQYYYLVGGDMKRP